MINWWLDKGIDGFRVDAISHIKKEAGLVDMPNPEGAQYVSSFQKHMNVEGIHDFLGELYENTFAKYDVMTVGEANGVSAEDAVKWVGEKEGKIDMVFQFEHLDLWDMDESNGLDVIELKRILSKWQTALDEDGWNALFIENHDIIRVVSKWGDDKEYWAESAKALALMYFLQKGTPFIYQGQELGMTNVRYDRIEDYRDVATHNRYTVHLNEGMTPEKALSYEWIASTDNARTPMQWEADEKEVLLSNYPYDMKSKNLFKPYEARLYRIR